MILTKVVVSSRVYVGKNISQVFHREVSPVGSKLPQGSYSDRSGYFLQEAEFTIETLVHVYICT